MIPYDDVIPVLDLEDVRICFAAKELANLFILLFDGESHDRVERSECASRFTLYDAGQDRERFVELMHLVLRAGSPCEAEGARGIPFQAPQRLVIFPKVQMCDADRPDCLGCDLTPWKCSFEPAPFPHTGRGNTGGISVLRILSVRAWYMNGAHHLR
jgi:hypothetical protein